MRTCLRALAILMTAASIVAFADAPAGAQTNACAQSPNLQCISKIIFALARTLPEADDVRRTHLFAEQELASGRLDVAVEYLNSDNPDPSDWDDIDWIARAGRFDRAIQQAREGDTPKRRVGGLIAIAEYLAKSGQKARATKLLEEIEPKLSDVDPEYAIVVVLDAAQVWAQLGQIDHAVRLLEKIEAGAAVEALLGLAKGNPNAAARLRRLAWSQAERANAAYVWRAIAKDAVERGDAGTAAQAGQRLFKNFRDQPHLAADVAIALVDLGRREQVGKAIDPWRAWISAESREIDNLLEMGLIPVLAKLGRAAEVEEAAQMVADPTRRVLVRAVDHLWRIGNTDLAEKLEEQIFREATVNRDEKLRSSFHSAFHNLALIHADHGDITEALAIVGRISDPARAAELTSYVIERAITGGYGDKAIPAIESLEKAALRLSDPNLLIKVSEAWSKLRATDAARNALAQALRIAGQPRQSKMSLDLTSAARLIWQLDGTTQAIRGALDRFVTTDDERSRLLDTMIDLLLPTSAGTALLLSEQIPDVHGRLNALARIAAQVAK